LINIIPVILSGGSGTRLWPLSRKQYPKQYLPLASDNTMLQETILRLNGLDNLADPIIICNADHRFLAAEQCQQIDITNPTILLEPVGRNTAPAIAAAALQSLKEVNDAVLLVLSADHVIQDVEAFHQGLILLASKHKRVNWQLLALCQRMLIRVMAILNHLRLIPMEYVRLKSLLKNPIYKRRSHTSSKATTYGTVACSCSKQEL